VAVAVGWTLGAVVCDLAGEGGADGRVVIDAVDGAALGVFVGAEAGVEAGVAVEQAASKMPLTVRASAGKLDARDMAKSSLVKQFDECPRRATSAPSWAYLEQSPLHSAP
jgi:hypothetical protein